MRSPLCSPAIHNGIFRRTSARQLSTRSRVCRRAPSHGICRRSRIRRLSNRSRVCSFAALHGTVRHRSKRQLNTRSRVCRRAPSHGIFRRRIKRQLSTESRVCSPAARYRIFHRRRVIRRRIIHLLTLLFSMVCSAPSVCAVTSKEPIHVSCETSSVLEGQSASITCHFPKDISIHRDSFYVYKYDFHRQHYLPDIVARCLWYDKQTSATCSTVEGFQFDGAISAKATLKIPVSSKNHSGVYVCDNITQDYSPKNGCNLYVRGRTINCTGATVSEGQPATIKCQYNSDLSVTHDSFYISRLRPHHKKYRDVLTCVWSKHDVAKPDCSVNPAFNYSDKVSRTVIIHIPAANQSHVGRYYCDIVPTRRDVKLRHCYVDVKAGSSTRGSTATTATDHKTTTASTSDYSPASSAEHECEGQKKTPEDMSLTAVILITFATAWACACIAGIVVVVRLLYIRKKRRQRQSPEPETGVVEPLREPMTGEATPNMDDIRLDDDSFDYTSEVCVNEQRPTTDMDTGNA